MAKKLKQIFTTGSDEVNQNFTIESWHISQSIDAFTGEEDYDIKISGSLTLTGSLFINETIESSGNGNVLTYNTTTGLITYTASNSLGAATSTDTGSLLTTASVSQNTITFTKGNGTTFPITVNTGSNETLPGGLNQQIQFNSASSFSGNSNFIYVYDSSSLQQGNAVTASGQYSHAEGLGTVASGSYQHVQGQYNLSSSAQSAFIIGNGTSNSDRKNLVFASGSDFQVTGSLKITGSNTTIGSSTLTGSLRVTGSTSTVGPAAVTGSVIVSGSGVYLSVLGSVNIGEDTLALGSISHAEGFRTSAVGVGSHTEGQYTTAIGVVSHAEGGGSTSVGTYSHAEGFGTKAIGEASHTEGSETTALAGYAHAEGYFTTALASGSHAEGGATLAMGRYSHTAGIYTTASSNAEGSYVGGAYNYSTGSYQHIVGKYNISSSVEGAFIVGDGTILGRKNLLVAASNTVQITGSLDISGSLIIPINTNALPNPGPEEGSIAIRSDGTNHYLAAYINGDWRGVQLTINL